jgi:hypothetical protein
MHFMTMVMSMLMMMMMKKGVVPEKSSFPRWADKHMFLMNMREA